ncbi:MAG TPA: aspartate-semialdehyde dehydrogenase [Bacteroidetes bacterium]|mgnify:CR=1 FL=1|nr:aspartate-semialdehyde dehydrogenase [Bacteroidota bacterium]HRK03515.1 aspartate-semialdehyde dehydrogenase [Chlorobiota bacterium]
MVVAIVGATGLVGRTMARVLEERQVPVSEIRMLASARSAGSVVPWKGDNVTVAEITEQAFDGVDVALFSAGGVASKHWAPIAASRGCVVIDNSSAWRMDPDVPLVVPEVNAADVHNRPKGIIANPNCSTIQLVVALKPLHDEYGLRRVVVSTYQSVSGAGQKGVDHLQAELAGRVAESRISSHPLAYNTVFHSFPESSEWSEEEVKMMRETRRILHLDSLPIVVTCVRVPVLGAHSESVAVETIRDFTISDVRSLLTSSPGIVVLDDPSHDVYPTPVQAASTDPVYVGRLRRDPSVERGMLLWVVADNLRKGAATNAVQILEVLQ